MDRIGLLERDDVLESLRDVVAVAKLGTSAGVLLSGEAGIGKTSVVRELMSAVNADVRVLSGACDDMLVPAPL